MKTETKEHIIDLAEKSLGRAASEAAKILRGKHLVSFAPNKAAGVSVKAINASKIRMTVKKMKTEFVKRYSGYPGGLKEISLEEIFKKDPTQVFKKAVERMLPRNKLRRALLKNLKISK